MSVMSIESRPAPEHEALVDLLGVLAHAELTACLRMCADAEAAPDIGVRVALTRMATGEFGHYERLAERIEALGYDPTAAMAPFEEAIADFHDRTAPGDWLEGLVKAYVGDGIAKDFYREVASHLPEEDAALICSVLTDTGQEGFVVELVTGAIENDPAVAGRLAMWGRRLVGEAMAQAQRVAVHRDGLAGLIVGEAGMDLGELGRLFTRLTQTHADRMRRLGLSP